MGGLCKIFSDKKLWKLEKKYTNQCYYFKEKSKKGNWDE